MAVTFTITGVNRQRITVRKCIDETDCSRYQGLTETLSDVGYGIQFINEWVVDKDYGKFLVTATKPRHSMLASEKHRYEKGTIPALVKGIKDIPHDVLHLHNFAIVEVSQSKFGLRLIDVEPVKEGQPSSIEQDIASIIQDLPTYEKDEGAQNIIADLTPLQEEGEEGE